MSRGKSNSMLEKKKGEVFTYAEVTKQKERKLSWSRKRDESKVALIYPNTEVESEVTRDVVKSYITPVSLAMGVRRMRKINKEGLLMELENKTDYDKLEIEIMSNKNLRESYS